MMGGEFILGKYAGITKDGFSLNFQKILDEIKTNNKAVDKALDEIFREISSAGETVNNNLKSQIAGKILMNTGYTFLLVGFLNLLPSLMTAIKNNLCKGSKDINFDTALKPLQDAMNQFTSLKPFKLI